MSALVTIAQWRILPRTRSCSVASFKHLTAVHPEYISFTVNAYISLYFAHMAGRTGTYKSMRKKNNEHT